MNSVTKQIKNFFISNKQLLLGLVVAFAIVIPVSATMVNSAKNSGKKPTNNSTQQTSEKTNSTTAADDKSGATNTSKTTSSTGPVSQNSTATNSSSSSNKVVSAKINNWQVSIYQINVTSCGTASNPCPWPTGVVLSIVAKNTDTGAYIPLKDCSITSSPVGFSIPGGSYSANPTVYSDAGVPVCGGGIDFPMGGHYRFGYEVWLPDSTNVDMPYKGGILMDYYLQPNH